MVSFGHNKRDPIQFERQWQTLTWRKMMQFHENFHRYYLYRSWNIGWNERFYFACNFVPFDGWLNLERLLLHGPYIYTEIPISKSLMNNNKKIYNELRSKNRMLNGNQAKIRWRKKSIQPNVPINRKKQQQSATIEMENIYLALFTMWMPRWEQSKWEMNESILDFQWKRSVALVHRNQWNIERKWIMNEWIWE